STCLKRSSTLSDSCLISSFVAIVAVISCNRSLTSPKLTQSDRVIRSCASTLPRNCLSSALMFASLSSMRYFTQFSKNGLSLRREHGDITPKVPTISFRILYGPRRPVKGLPRSRRAIYFFFFAPFGGEGGRRMSGDTPRPARGDAP